MLQRIIRVQPLRVTHHSCVYHDRPGTVVHVQVTVVKHLEAHQGNVKVSPIIIETYWFNYFLVKIAKFRSRYHIISSPPHVM